MAEIIDGKSIALAIRNEVKTEVASMPVKPGLAVIQVGDDPASSTYVRNKHKACSYVGMQSFEYHLPKDTAEETLIELIHKLNNLPEVDGILVQLPLPAQIDQETVIRAIDPAKDVDGFHPVNVGALVTGMPGFVPCTPAGIIELLYRTGIEIAGKRCVVVGRSNIVGKPAAILMLRENATVTVAHSKTLDLPEVTKFADILIAAVGKPRFITADYVRPGAVVIDVGIHHTDAGMCGDVDYNGVFPVASYITPVPGGVGPMTIAMLMKNCLEACKLHRASSSL